MSALREQVVTSRARNVARSGIPVTQRPARRAKRVANGASWGRLAMAMPWLGKALLAVGAGVLLFATYRATASATIFQLARVDVEGGARTSREEIQAVVRRIVGREGVWRADVWAIKGELEKLPWVREAIVSRVLPSTVRVRIRERAPYAVARTSQGRLLWVDEEGVLLGEFASSDEIPPFLIRGLDEAPTEASRRTNRERLARYREMLNEWRARGLVERVSEVNLGDLRDVRAQLAGADSGIEVRLGGRDFGARLERALKALAEMRQAGREVVSLDATQDRRVIVGLASGARLSDGASAGPVTPPSGAKGANRRRED